MEIHGDGGSRCSITESPVREVLDRLFRETARQLPSLVRLVATEAVDQVLRRSPSLSRDVARLRHLYVPVSPKQGELLYLLARSLRATRIVEFGTSFGISTLYLAAAIRDNGGGIVIGSELEPSKRAAAERHLEEAGLSEWAEIREGDARQTLADPGGPVDLAFLDGHAPLYLPLLKLLLPHLRPGAAVLADNLLSARRDLREYQRFVRDPANGFYSVSLWIKDGMSYAVRLADGAGGPPAQGRR